jgi:hypothetical protein
VCTCTYAQDGLHPSTSASACPAVRSHLMTLNTYCLCWLVAAAGKDHSKVLDEHVSGFVEKAKTMSAQVRGLVRGSAPTCGKQ